MVYSHLILGGARSGKSRRGLNLAEKAAARRAFIATAEALDEEMSTRIEHHKAERDAYWTTIEAPLDLVGALQHAKQQNDVCLVDCLTLWLSNLMRHGHNINAETECLCTVISTYPASIIFVSNEVGLGLVPETPLGRSFRDAQGQLNQAVAAVCDKVEFVVAGLPITLKG